MQKKYFIKFANFIKNHLDSGQSIIGQDQIKVNEARLMAEMVTKNNDNPNFNKQRFLIACGLN